MKNIKKTRTLNYLNEASNRDLSIALTGLGFGIGGAALGDSIYDAHLDHYNSEFQKQFSDINATKDQLLNEKFGDPENNKEALQSYQDQYNKIKFADFNKDGFVDEREYNKALENYKNYINSGGNNPFSDNYKNLDYKPDTVKQLNTYKNLLHDKDFVSKFDVNQDGTFNARELQLLKKLPEYQDRMNSFEYQPYLYGTAGAIAGMKLMDAATRGESSDKDRINFPSNRFAPFGAPKRPNESQEIVDKVPLPPIVK